MTRRPKHSQTKPEILSFADADQRLDGALGVFQGGYDRVLVIPGDVTVKGDFETAMRKLATGSFDLIAIAGDLTVDGRIALYNSTPGLYVGGTTTAETLEGGDCEVYIEAGTFVYFVYGYYNDGILETGLVKTPWVINSNHDLRVSAGKETKWIDNYGDDDDYDFGSENIAQSFVRGVLGGDGNEIDIKKFYQHLAAGKPVLVAGAKTGKEQALAAVKTAKGTRKTELVVTTTKLKAFPKDALKMPWLTRLVLDGNEIGEVPESIGKLTELEELSLVGCGLAKLPEAIGKLTKLRVLRIGGNTSWDWSGDDAVCRPIRLPKSFGKLVNLEELDVSNLSAEVRGQDERPLPDITPFELPASVAKLVKLRVLHATHTNLVLPRAAWKLPIEELVMEGSSWCYLKTFPEFIPSLTRLRKLDVSSNFFTSIPDLSKLRDLEELDLGNALGRVKKLPDLSKLPRLRVLNVSGNTDRTNVAAPKHDVLRPLFAMRLPAIEDLRIDRWGENEYGRGNLSPTTIAGIGRFTTLKRLDLQFDGLAKLPPDFYKLPALEQLALEYNRLGKQELARIKKAFPKAKITVGIQD